MIESRVSSFASQLSPLQKNAFKLSMTRTASNSSGSSTGTLNSPSIASSRRPLPAPHTYQQSETYTEDQPTSRFERDFVVDSEIGSGEFGKVIKVRCKDGKDSDIYAVKQSKRVEGPRHRYVTRKLPFRARKLILLFLQTPVARRSAGFAASVACRKDLRLI